LIDFRRVQADDVFNVIEIATNGIFGDAPSTERG